MSDKEIKLEDQGEMIVLSLSFLLSLIASILNPANFVYACFSISGRRLAMPGLTAPPTPTFLFHRFVPEDTLFEGGSGLCDILKAAAPLNPYYAPGVVSLLSNVPVTDIISVSSRYSALICS